MIFKMKRIYIAILFAVFALNIRSQIITTVAGNGLGGYNGDGGQATDAWLQGIFGIAIDPSGNIFISDYWHHVIRKVNTLGIISTFVGKGTQGYSGDGGQATDAEISAPYHIASDIVGNIYVTDAIGVIRKINTSGIISTVAGNGTVGYSGDGGVATSAELNAPVGIAIDNHGNIYIADQNNYVIRKVNTLGIITTIAGNGTFGFNGDGIAATSAELNQPSGVTVDAIGNIYIADWNNNRVRKVDTLGMISTIAGTGISGNSGNGGNATSAQLHLPKAVFADLQGNVYVADGSLVQKIDTAGIINIVAGTVNGGYNGDGGAATAAEIAGPTAIAFDALGNLYIGDEGNYRIRKVTNVTQVVIQQLSITGGQINIYPNPAQQIINIEFKTQNNIQATIEIFNVMGECVHRHNTTSSNCQINAFDFNEGVYNISITNNVSTINKKLLIVR
jgi:hypothetical protein